MAYGEDDGGALILRVSQPIKCVVRVVLERDDQDATIAAARWIAADFVIQRPLAQSEFAA